MEKILDARGLKCPMPIAKANKHINLIKQATETDENGREIYVHYLSRVS